MYKTGQLIWLKDIDNFSGKLVKESRLCIVRRIYEDGKIDLRNLSTIYYDKSKNIKARSLEEARGVLENLFEGKSTQKGQYVICEPSKDNTLNFSYTFGGLVSQKIDLSKFNHSPLLDKTGKELFISPDTELELSIKEAEAIAQDIIYYFTIGTKKKSVIEKIFS